MATRALACMMSLSSRGAIGLPSAVRSWVLQSGVSRRHSPRHTLFPSEHSANDEPVEAAAALRICVIDAAMGAAIEVVAARAAATVVLITPDPAVDIRAAATVRHDRAFAEVDALPALADVIGKALVAAASAIVVVIVEMDALSVALDRRIGADTLAALAGAALGAFVAAFAAVMVIRRELDAEFAAITGRAADLAVFRFAAVVSTHMWAAAVAVSVFLEAVVADALVQGVRVGSRVEGIGGGANAEAIGRAAERAADLLRCATDWRLLATRGALLAATTAGAPACYDTALANAFVPLALRPSATVALIAALLPRALAACEDLVQAEVVQSESECSRGQAAQCRTTGFPCRQPPAECIETLSVHHASSSGVHRRDPVTHHRVPGCLRLRCPP
jgi:hypothetical protein